MTRTAFLLSPAAFESVYAGAPCERITRRATVLGPFAPHDGLQNHLDALRQIEAIFTGWGAPVLDDALLAAMPNLRAVFHGAGSVRSLITDTFWQRGVKLCGASQLNAIPVSEYVVGAALLGLKRFWHHAALTRARKTFAVDRPVLGAYGTTIGLISYGAIARRVRQQLRSHDLKVCVWDPFLDPLTAQNENVTLCSLEELFATADVVSLHSPVRPETLGLIRGAHLASMKPGTVFINTARGEIVNEPEMIAVLQRRHDLQAILDVTSPEPPAADSPLYTLPNVLLTPHIAGSLGPECQRMGHAMVDEFERLLTGQPLHFELHAERVALMA